MKTFFHAWGDRSVILALGMAVLPCRPISAAETNATASAEGAAKKTLATENSLLREENRKLREELVQGEATAQKTTQISAAAADSSAVTNGAVLYWVTSGSKVRHNPSCRYYKKSKGHLTTEKAGTPCKICGG